MDIGLILAATTQEPGLVSWLLWKTLAWLGVAGGLTFVIFVHELGHFLVAKACGVRVLKFCLGFGPPVRLGRLRHPFELPNAIQKHCQGAFGNDARVQLFE